VGLLTSRRVLVYTASVVGVGLMTLLGRSITSSRPPGGLFPERIWVKWGASDPVVAATRNGPKLARVDVVAWSAHRDPDGHVCPRGLDLAEDGPSTLLERINWYLSGTPDVDSRNVWLANYEVLLNEPRDDVAWHECVRKGVESGNRLVLRR
jgi:hypothetical protein